MYRYIAKSGVLVETCRPDSGPKEDFPTALHYLFWSYKTWGKKIIKAVRLYGIDWS